MDILDYVIPKKGWSIPMPRVGAGGEEEPQAAEDERVSAPAKAEAEDEGPVSQETDEDPAAQTGEAAEAATPEPAPPEPVITTETPVGEAAEAATPEPASRPSSREPSATRAEPSGGEGPLEADLRDLFAEASVVDPQLASLVRRIDRVAADDLAAELKDFSRAIGAEGAGSEGRTPG